MVTRSRSKHGVGAGEAVVAAGARVRVCRRGRCWAAQLNLPPHQGTVPLACNECNAERASLAVPRKCRRGTFCMGSGIHCEQLTLTCTL